MSAAPHIQEHIADTLYRASARRGEVYAVVDPARDPRIFPMLPDELGRAICLYEGVLPRSVARNAPYLLSFKGPWDPVLRDVLAKGWGDSWGVFLTTSVDRYALRTHLRRFLKVQTEAGKVLLFRYYDPRVLLPFLGAVNAEERRTFFGPIDCFWVETEGGKRVAELTTGGTKLGSQTIALPQTGAVA